MGETLGGIVDLFSCCVLTWDIFFTVVPALFFAGAIHSLVPPETILRVLGTRTHPLKSYSAAILSGVALEVCSCNVVPMFLYIARRGAGLGPAVVFLYSAPAINVLSMTFVFRVIGWRMGVWRIVLTVAISVLVGLLMALLFGRGATVTDPGQTVLPEEEGRPRARPAVLAAILGLFVVILGVGTSTAPLGTKTAVAGPCVLGVAALARWALDPRLCREWLRDTWLLARTVLPVFIPSVLIVGLLAVHVPIRWVSGTLSGDSVLVLFLAALFAGLMYFPIMTEVVLVKALLILGMDAGAGMAILLTGPGLSLPTILLIRKAMPARKLLAYVILLLLLATAAAYLFDSVLGDYICPCRFDTPPSH